MGLIKSKPCKNINNDTDNKELLDYISNLGNRIVNLEHVVIKLENENLELTNKIAKQSELVGMLSKPDKIIKYKNKVHDANVYIEELEKQIKVLNDLHKKKGLNLGYFFKKQDIKENQTPDTTNATPNATTIQIERIVNDLLNDESINIKYFPDFVERQLYMNVITMIIHLLRHFLDESNVTFMGHKLTFELEAIPINTNYATIDN
ncbi:hypothetical protein Hokovirus_1_113 [Hokovirus HKV1]|uniref:Uncharacterized protein n=1 Tax=Hokovirus HKV1 TaxID=1977638 RepID=A0A1V0SF27_9VIRU|nr:hypothetical protein Hokovirus_1_113 [Hokovirus HKV1]